MSNVLNTLPSLHPIFEVGSAVSIFAFFIRDSITLRFALLSANVLTITSGVMEGGTTDLEAVAWNVLHLSCNACVLVGLIRKRAAFRPFGEDRRSTVRDDVWTVARCRAAWTGFLTAQGSMSDRHFF